MASGVVTSFKTALMKKELDLVNDTHKVGLLNNSHAFDATDNGWADISANEISGTGYTAGGETLANEAVTADGTVAKWDADNVAWSTATFSAYHAGVYNDTVTTPQADQLYCTIDFGGVQTVTAGTFTIQWHADGIIRLT